MQSGLVEHEIKNVSKLIANHEVVGIDCGRVSEEIQQYVQYAVIEEAEVVCKQICEAPDRCVPVSILIVDLHRFFSGT